MGVKRDKLYGFLHRTLIPMNTRHACEVAVRYLRNAPVCDLVCLSFVSLPGVYFELSRFNEPIFPRANNI